MRIYLCENTFGGMMTAVYDAWASKLGHDNVKLALQGEYCLELFSEYVIVEEDTEKAKKVTRTLKKISGEVFECVYRASMSPDSEKADRIYRFIVLAVHNGASVMDQLNIPAVKEVFSMAGRVKTEAHRFLQFIRFRELENGVLFSRIDPKSQVIELIAPHFEDRLPGENWLIYDATHKLAAIHAKNMPWLLVRDAQIGEALSSEQQEGYEELWKIFFRTISIEARENPRCQRNMLPLWYRKNMLEFEEGEGRIL